MTNLIYRGDTFPLVVSWFLPDPNSPYTENDATINEAAVKVIRSRDNRVMIENDPATIDGNEAIYIVPVEAHQIDSEYAALVTATFNDGSIKTERVEFRVTARR